MLLVSPSFDILMLHPSFEALWHRPGSTFLGKKCYREIEKREEPCPHCPGVIALRTGAAAEVESCAVLDDGTRVPFMLRALPVYGAAGEPAGFVETCQNISERRRGEDDARFEVTLINDLLGTSSTSRVLGLGLDAALRLDGAASGCVFALGPGNGVRELVAQRGLEAAEIESLPSLMTNSTVATPQGASLVVHVPVLCNAEPVAELVVRLAGDPIAWISSRSRLEAVALVVASALARIRADRLRGDAGMNMQTIVSTIPLATLFLDDHGAVTVWNEASERMFGWPEHDALGHVPAFVPGGDQERFFSLVSNGGGTSRAPGFKFRCLDKVGRAFDVWFRAASIRDVTGDGSSHLVVATGVESGASSWADSNGGAPKRVPTESSHVSGPAPEALDHEALSAAHALERLFTRISSGLSPAQNLVDNVASGAADAFGDIVGGSMSVSWTKEGALDIHGCLAAAEELSPRVLGPAHALVIQSDEESGKRLERILQSLGYSTTVCTSISAAVGHLRTSQDRGRPADFAIVEMVMPEGPGAVETAKLLRVVVPGLQVVVSSERGVVGHAAHGFAAAISRPYADDTVKIAAIEALRQRSR